MRCRQQRLPSSSRRGWHHQEREAPDGIAHHEHRPQSIRLRPKWLRPTIEPGRRGDKLRGDDAKPAKLRLISAGSQPPARRPGCELWPNWRVPLASSPDMRRMLRHQSSRRLATETTPQSSSPSADLKEGSGLSRCPSRTVLRHDGAFGSPMLRCCWRTTSPAGSARLGAHPPRAPTHRRGHHPQPAPHRARAASSTHSVPTQTGACRSTGPGQNTLHHRPATNPQPAPAHLSRPQRPAQRRPTPPATNRRTSPAPQSCGRPKTRRPAYTHQPSGHPAPTADPTSPSVRFRSVGELRAGLIVEGWFRLRWLVRSLLVLVMLLVAVAKHVFCCTRCRYQTAMSRRALVAGVPACERDISSCSRC